MRFLAMYADMMDGIEIFWGVSPIMSARSQSYWELKNNVVFPREFAPTLDWSIDFARRVLDFVGRTNDGLYLMPIKSNLMAYLSGVFTK